MTPQTLKKSAFFALFLFIGCQPGALQWSDDDSAFFANSLRRAPLPDEPNARAIVNLFMCTGYFVGNDQGKVLIMSANHCFDNKPAEWCAKPSAVAVDEAGSAWRHCQRVVVAEAGSDLALFEFDGPPPPATLALLEAGTVVSRRLVMYGYPSDQFAHEGLNVTENCWIRSKADRNLRLANPKDLNYTHNCSTYGGNSGGPMVAEGSRAVVGQPQSYFKDDFGNKLSDGDRVAWGTDMTPFIRRNRSTLNALGVEIVQRPSEAPANTPTAVTVHSGTYKDRGCLGGYATSVRAEYNTNGQLTSMAVRWTLSSGAYARATYDCLGELCTQSNGSRNTWVRIVNLDTIEYGHNGSEDGCELKLTKMGSY
jgi:hypothetical protein